MRPHTSVSSSEPTASTKCSFCGVGPAAPDIPDPDRAGRLIHSRCLEVRRGLDARCSHLSRLTSDPWPYRRLAAEVAALAVEDYLRRSSERQQAEEFIFGPQEHHALSFRDCCEALGVSYERAKKVLWERRHVRTSP